MYNFDTIEYITQEVSNAQNLDVNALHFRYKIC